MTKLYGLFHPPDNKIFSGYGIESGNRELKGLLMVDRPFPVDTKWLSKIESIFGSYELFPMTNQGDRGIACYMLFNRHNWQHLQLIDFALTKQMVNFAHNLNPSPRFKMSWDDHLNYWVSEIVK